MDIPDDVTGRRLVILRRIPSQNRSQYAHWSTYCKERDTWFVLMRAQLPPRQRIAQPVRLVLRSYRTRLVDYANLVGGAKPIPDILARLGYIHDDSPRWFYCEYQQIQVAKADERTEIEFIPWSGLDEEDSHG
jgi:hypothetical protein